jgi:hypothetical protein
MSSTSRSPDDSPESTEDPEKKTARSPGRYSLATDEGGAVPPTRVDSTTRMPAVRVDGSPPPSVRSASQSADAAPPAGANVPTRASTPPKEKEKPRKPPTLPHRAPQTYGTHRAMPAPLARGAAPSNPDLSTEAIDLTASDVEEEIDALDSEARAADAKALAKKAASIAPKAREASIVPPRSPSNVPAGMGRRTSSLRPPAPGKLGVPSTPPALALNLELLDEGSIAFAFDALVSEGPAGQPGTHKFDLAPVRELFAELAANHMRHVRDFMIDVKWGEVTRDWIHVCLPPVRTLRRAAERLELVELGVALERVGAELDSANAAGGQMLDVGEKERLLSAYNELVTILPQAFALDRDKTQREAVIVQALLLQVPDVRKVTIDKLHAAGLTSLTVLFDANAHDIAHVAGIPHSLASRIVDRVQAYRSELKSSSPQDARAVERDKLASLNGALKQHHDAYEEAANGWAADAKVKKRDHFKAREETWLEISVLLARFGEVDRLQGIEKVPFAQRIAQLTEYLEEAREKYRSAEA